MATTEDVLQNTALPTLDEADTEVDAASSSVRALCAPMDASAQVMHALKLLTESYEREQRSVRSGTRLRSRPSSC